MVTHDLDLMYKVADRVVFLYDEGSSTSGLPPTWKNRPIRTFGNSWKWIGWKSADFDVYLRPKKCFNRSHMPAGLPLLFCRRARRLERSRNSSCRHLARMAPCS